MEKTTTAVAPITLQDIKRRIVVKVKSAGNTYPLKFTGSGLIETCEVLNVNYAQKKKDIGNYFLYLAALGKIALEKNVINLLPDEATKLETDIARIIKLNNPPETTGEIK
jgi:hypothetical protein